MINTNSPRVLKRLADNPQLILGAMAKFGPAVLGAIFILLSGMPLLAAKFPYMLLNGDSLDAYYPLFTYFIDGMKQGEIFYYHPFLFAGERLLGNATFQPNPIQLLVGFLFGSSAIYGPLNPAYILEPLVGYFGIFFLLGALGIKIPSYTRAILAVAYSFSLGYAVFLVFPTMSLHFSILPWILYFLVRAQNSPSGCIFAALFFLLYVQFAYGFLQFSVYVIWLALFFALFWAPWPKKARVTALLAASGIVATLASAHFLIPLVDNLYIAEGSSAARVADKLNIMRQLVPDFYLIRLFVPGIEDHAAPWWPLRESNWSELESFSVYQGLPIAMLAVFGLFLSSTPRFFRAMYILLVVSVVTSFGVMALYFINLGAEVPYGRQTALLEIVTPIIAGYALYRINHDRKIAGAFTLWCLAFSILFFSILLFKFPEAIVEYAFSFARAAFNLAYDPSAAGNFYRSYSAALTKEFGQPFIWAISSSLIAAMAFIRLRSRATERGYVTPAVLTALLCLLALAQAYSYSESTGIRAMYAKVIDREKAEGGGRVASLSVRHPVEDALIAAGAQVSHGPVKYRMHVDIYFQEQRTGAEQTWRITGASPEENRFRTLPNALAGERIPVTTGYQNVVPQANEYTDMMIPHYGQPFWRAMGERATLHPYIMDAFSIRWVLRHQPDVIDKLNGRQDFAADRWEQRFLASSRLIYSDSTYRLYEYLGARPAFDVPDRIVFGDRASDALRALESPDQPWIPTAAIPEQALAMLAPEFEARITAESGVKTFRQSGKIVKADGEAGSWTQLEVEADTSALVLIGTKFDPWWKVTVNGQPAPLIRANGIFAAVQVPAGKSEVMVTLRPYSVWIGVAVSAATFLVMLIGFAATYAYRRLRRPAGGQADGVRV